MSDLSPNATLRIFISWSGPIAREVATAIHRLLQNISDQFAPWMSDLDIEGGQRGMQEIEHSLNGAQFGMLVITPENQHSPWMNFEAGALSKVVDGNEANLVVPLLVGIERPTDVVGPIGQFQALRLTRDDVKSLVESIAARVDVRQQTISERFDAFWDGFERQITAINLDEKPREEARPTSDILDEVLDHVRAIRRDKGAAKSSVAPFDVGSRLREAEAMVAWARRSPSMGQLRDLVRMWSDEFDPLNTVPDVWIQPLDGRDTVCISRPSGIGEATRERLRTFLIPRTDMPVEFVQATSSPQTQPLREVGTSTVTANGVEG